MTVFVLYLLALALVVVPGALICVAAGSSWRDGFVAGPALTAAVTGVACLASMRTDTHWGPVTALLAAVAAVCAALLFGTAVRAVEWRLARRGTAGAVASPEGAPEADGADTPAGETTAGVSAPDDTTLDDTAPDDTAPDDASRSGRRRRTRPSPRGAFASVLVLLLSLLPAVQVAVTTRGFTAIPQGWDGIFHGAAVRFIAVTGLAGPGDLGPVSQPLNEHFFYPNTYHALGALLVGAPGGGLPQVLDALSAVTGTLFVIGTAALSARLAHTAGARRTAAGRTGWRPSPTVAAVASAVAAAGSWVFPFAVIGRGQLLPYAFGLALLPGVLLLAERVCTGPRRLSHAALLAAALVGAWSVHPSVALAVSVPLAVRALVALVVPDPAPAAGTTRSGGASGAASATTAAPTGSTASTAVATDAAAAPAGSTTVTATGLTTVTDTTTTTDTVTGSSVPRSGWRTRLAVAGCFAIAALFAGAFALVHVRFMRAGAEDMRGYSWPPTDSVPQALASVLDLGPDPWASVGLSVAVLLGLGVVVARRGPRSTYLPQVVLFVVAATFVVLTKALELDWVRVVSSYFWDDSFRFAALLAMPAALLAGLGVSTLLTGTLVSSTPGRGRVRRHLPVVVTTVLALLVAVGQASVVPELRKLGYSDGDAVRPGERALIDALGARYGGGTVLNDPFDGMAWVYALHGVPVLFPAPLTDKPGEQLGPARMDLYTSMDRYGYEPLVAQRVRELDVRWVVVGSGVVWGSGRPMGFVGLHLNPHLRLVEENSQARLYEVLPVDPSLPPQAPPPGIPLTVPLLQPANTDSPVVGRVPAPRAASLEPPN